MSKKNRPTDRHTSRLVGMALILAICAGTGVYYVYGQRVNPASETDASGLTERRGGYFSVIDENAETILTTGHMLYVGDEFISENDIKYSIERISGDVAVAKTLGPVEALSLTPAGQAVAKDKGAKGTVGIYHTHTDESYIPTDGTDSTPGKGGVVSVGKTMADKLQAKGVKVVHDTTPHDPHDAGAYDRSRRTAAQILKQGPVALFDVHRDAGPAEPYLKQEGGREVARAMVVVGRTNPRMSANLDFARRLKDAVNSKYPGLIKGILLGKADFNQDLSQRALLLEVGTEKTSREAAESGVALIAGVIPEFLGIVGAPGGKTTGTAIGWLLGVTVAAIFVYLWVSTGSWEEMQAKIMGWFGSGGVRVGGGEAGRGEAGRGEPGAGAQGGSEDDSPESGSPGGTRAGRS